MCKTAAQRACLGIGVQEQKVRHVPLSVGGGRGGGHAVGVQDVRVEVGHGHVPHVALRSVLRRRWGLSLAAVICLNCESTM